MSVQQLPPATVKQICSAQVITSVSSVVKELLENSLDAKASHIHIRLENHGLSKIEVLDNGKGISTEDAWKMCKKSYTSKIKTFDDLNKLTTYGFRGEALHSLCAVAEVQVTTKTDKDYLGMAYEFNKDGDIVRSKHCPLSNGTIVSVRNLFENLPVRKQYLSNEKRKAAEIKKAEMIIKMLAVIHPRVRISLTHNKLHIWHKTSVSSIRLSLSQTISPVVVKQLVDLRYSSEEVHLQLLIPGKGCNISSVCFKNSGETKFLYVNKRPIKDRNIEKILHTEITNYFGNEIPNGKHLSWLVSISLPSDRVDVNLEPNKTRVLLVNMDQIGAILRNQLSNYYVGTLEAPTEFLESIDAEVSTMAEKRKSSEDIEIKLKVPKLTQETLEEPSTSQSSPLKLHTPVYNAERDKNIKEFLSGLETSRSDNKSEEDSHKAPEAAEVSVSDTSNSCEETGPTASTGPVPSPMVEKEEDSSDPPVPLDINHITLSQWSRGDVKIGGTTVPGSVTLLGTDENLNSGNSVSSAPVSLDNSTVIDLTEEESNDGDSETLGENSDNRILASFTKSASDIVMKQSSIMSFGRIASNIAKSWKQMQEPEEEEEMPCERPISEPGPSKQRSEKEAKVKKISEQLKAVKARKKRTYPKTVDAGISIGTIRTALWQRVSQAEVSRVKSVGDLSEDVKCAWESGGMLYAFSERRLAESLLFNTNLDTMVVPHKTLHKSIHLDSETLGHDLWMVLSSLFPVLEDEDTLSGVTEDNRITWNGLRIIRDRRDDSLFKLTRVPLNVACFGVDDVMEILTVIGNHPNAPVKACRPLKIVTYIRAETIRQISKGELTLKCESPAENFNYWMENIKPFVERCPHEKGVYQIIDIPE